MVAWIFLVIGCLLGTALTNGRTPSSEREIFIYNFFSICWTIVIYDIANVTNRYIFCKLSQRLIIIDKHYKRYQILSTDPILGVGDEGRTFSRVGVHALLLYYIKSNINLHIF